MSWIKLLMHVTKKLEIMFVSDLRAVCRVNCREITNENK